MAVRTVYRRPDPEPALATTRSKPGIKLDIPEWRHVLAGRPAADRPVCECPGLYWVISIFEHGWMTRYRLGALFLSKLKSPYSHSAGREKGSVNQFANGRIRLPPG
ncbi:MAG: hypothetical protein LBE84_04915 [Planctomycetota bacterium]|jgi:hypothetical protein|nr:hypothetical protein [Planctomycetota bacterium]